MFVWYYDYPYRVPSASTILQCCSKSVMLHVNYYNTHDQWRGESSVCAGKSEEGCRPGISVVSLDHGHYPDSRHTFPSLPVPAQSEDPHPCGLHVYRQLKYVGTPLQCVYSIVFIIPCFTTNSVVSSFPG